MVLVIPTAAIRGEGTSRLYLSSGFPAIPDSSVNLYCIGAPKSADLAPHCGIVYTTGRRLWELEEDFIEYIRSQRTLARSLSAFIRQAPVKI